MIAARTPCSARRLLIGSLICIAAIATFCRNIKDLELTGLKGFTVDEIGMKGVKGEIMLGIRNPNNFGFRIYKSAFDVNYAGVKLGQARLTKPVRIHAGEERTYAFRLESDFAGADIGSVMKLLQGASRRESLEVTGDLHAGTLFFRKKFPVALHDAVKLK